MKNFLARNSFYSIVFILVIGCSFFLGYNIGVKKIPEASKISSLINKTSAETPETIDFDPFWKAWNVLNEKYVAQKEKIPTDQEKVWGAISGLTQSLGDPYTVFFPPEQASLFESEISGNFEGVGMEVGIKDGVLTVVAPLKGTPAEKAGIQTGDKILKIDDALTTDLSVDKAVKLIRGKKGTEVRLTVYRESRKEPFEIKIVRDVISIPTIETEVKSKTTSSSSDPNKSSGLRKDGVFIIRLFSFSENSPNLFRGALREFWDSGSNKLILDLRGNPGGYLEAAVDMASWFLPAGKVIVKEEYAHGKEGDVFRSRGYNIFEGQNLKMVILVNNGSASASEILAGALREYGIAKLVGSKTFGKGSVQELVKITPDTSLKVTIARWLTPNGVSISEEGLKPDFEVSISEEDIKNKNDSQLNKAVEILLSE